MTIVMIVLREDFNLDQLPHAMAGRPSGLRRPRSQLSAAGSAGALCDAAWAAAWTGKAWSPSSEHRIHVLRANGRTLKFFGFLIWS